MDSFKLLSIIFILNFASLTVCDLVKDRFVINKSLKKLLGYPEENYENFAEEAGAKGYLTETHYVTTEDGYILTVFRLRDPKCINAYHKVPTILMHGWLVNADSYLVAGEKEGLGYLFAQSCYDVWAGAYRGCNYGRNHTTLNPDKDAEFWDYNVDEIAFYDNAAIVDYVIAATSSEKVNWVGHSQGAGSIILTVAERKEYNEKLGLIVAVSPHLILKNIKSIALKVILKATALFQDILSKLGIKEMFAKDSVIQTVVEFLCQSGKANAVCTTVLRLFDTVHPDGTDADTAKRLFSVLFMGCSVKLTAGYQQWIDSNLIAKYDYGAEGNLKVYGSESAPLYNLNNAKVPTVLVAGLSDAVIDSDNVVELGTMLPNLLETVTLSDKLWNHVDTIANKNISSEIFPIINKHLSQHSN